MEPNRTPRPSEALEAEPRPSRPARGRGRIPAIARAAGRSCSRPGCDTPAAATLVFSYAEQIARLVELYDVDDPQTYDLCGPHADRTSPPRGWELADARPPRADRPRPLDEDETVAVLAAALRGETPPVVVDVIRGSAPASAPAVAPRVAHEVDPDVDEDPLRAALEELQRVAAEDDRDVAPVRPPIELNRPRGGGPHIEDDLTLW